MGTWVFTPQLTVPYKNRDALKGIFLPAKEPFETYLQTAYCDVYGVCSHSTTTMALSQKER